jgi:multicomponent Na+:H+ antiporter subunit E
LLARPIDVADRVDWAVTFRAFVAFGAGVGDMLEAGSVDTARNVRGVLARTVFFFGFWLILYGANPADLVVGALVAIAASWTSVRLLTPGQWRINLVALSKLVLRFPSQSIVAGIDVAWRALDPRMPLRPGFVIYPVRFPPGSARNAFTTLTSLLPGTVPAGDKDGQLVYHCLDVDQPVVSQLAAEEAALSRAFGNE